MLSLSGIWLLVALTDGSQVGLKSMPSMEACQAQAATYRAQPDKYTRIECMGNPIIGSPSVFSSQPIPSELVDVFAKILRGVGQ